MGKLISIIVPIFNAEKYLRNCLDSVLSQNIKKEIICVDDGSKDNSMDILNEYVCKYDEIKVIRGEHNGTGEARNIGIRAASGEFIAFMDADDYYPDDQVLNKLYNCAIDNDVSIAGGNRVEIDESGNLNYRNDKFETSEIRDYYDYQNIYGFQKFIYDKRLFKDNNLFPPYVRFEDPPFLINIMAQNRKFYSITNIVYCHRANYKSVSFNYGIALGLLNGIRDAILFCYKYNLKVAYENHLKNILRENVKDYYKYLYDLNDDFWKVIDSICEIEHKWLGKIQWDYSREQFIEWIDEYRLLETSFSKIRHDDIPVIIYGAGYYGKMIHELFFCDYEKFMGYAVTDIASNRTSDSESSIRCINDYMEYKDRVEVIIGVKSVVEQDEMFKTLNELGLESITKIDEALFYLFGI